MEKWIAILIALVIFIILLLPCHPEDEKSKSKSTDESKSESETIEKFDAPENLTKMSYLSPTEDIGTNTIANPQNYGRFFNDVHTTASINQSASDFYNPYFALYMQEQVGSQTLKEKCYPFKNINQCMSICSADPMCTAFHIKDNGTCCPIIEPDFRLNKDSVLFPPDNPLFYGFNKLNQQNLSNVSEDQIFRYYDYDNGNNSYSTQLDCSQLCPKCILGQCPDNYRCENVRNDITRGIPCIITNNDQYDENSGKIFDGADIKSLKDQYANANL